MANKICAIIFTKNRYYLTLPLVWQSLINQTHKPNYIIIVDDSICQVDIENIDFFKCLFEQCILNNIEVKLLRSPNIGLTMNVKRVLEYINTNMEDIRYIFKLDDDFIPHTNFIHNFFYYKNKIENMGAFSSRTLIPKLGLVKYSEKIKDIFTHYSPQLISEIGQKIVQTDVFEVEHIHCSYIFDLSIKNKLSKNYLMLSKIGNREDTIFTHEIFLDNNKLVIDNTIESMHLKIREGGTRIISNYIELYNHDDNILKKMLK